MPISKREAQLIAKIEELKSQSCLISYCQYPGCIINVEFGDTCLDHYILPFTIGTQTSVSVEEKETQTDMFQTPNRPWATKSVPPPPPRKKKANKTVSVFQKLQTEAIKSLRY